MFEKFWKEKSLMVTGHGNIGVISPTKTENTERTQDLKMREDDTFTVLATQDVGYTFKWKYILS